MEEKKLLEQRDVNSLRRMKASRLTRIEVLKMEIKELDEIINTKANKNVF